MISAADRLSAPTQVRVTDKNGIFCYASVKSVKISADGQIVQIRHTPQGSSLRDSEVVETVLDGRGIELEMLA